MAPHTKVQRLSQHVFVVNQTFCSAILKCKSFPGMYSCSNQATCFAMFKTQKLFQHVFVLDQAICAALGLQIEVVYSFSFRQLAGSQNYTYIIIYDIYVCVFNQAICSATPRCQKMPWTQTFVWPHHIQVPLVNV